MVGMSGLILSAQMLNKAIGGGKDYALMQIQNVFI